MHPGGDLEVWMHPGGGLEVWMPHVRISRALQAGPILGACFPRDQE
jgi:hypothetical protein